MLHKINPKSANTHHSSLITSGYYVLQNIEIDSLTSLEMTDSILLTYNRHETIDKA